MQLTLAIIYSFAPNAQRWTLQSLWEFVLYLIVVDSVESEKNTALRVICNLRVVFRLRVLYARAAKSGYQISDTYHTRYRIVPQATFSAKGVAWETSYRTLFSAMPTAIP